MLGRKSYTQEELDHCQAAVGQQLAAYRSLVDALSGGANDPKARSALEELATGAPASAPRSTQAYVGSTRCTVPTRSIDRSNEAILPIPVVSAHATRYASAKSIRASS